MDRNILRDELADARQHLSDATAEYDKYNAGTGKARLNSLKSVLKGAFAGTAIGFVVGNTALMAMVSFSFCDEQSIYKNGGDEICEKNILGRQAAIYSEIHTAFTNESMADDGGAAILGGILAFPTMLGFAFGMGASAAVRSRVDLEASEKQLAELEDEANILDM